MRWGVRRAFFSLQVFLLMSTPLPQTAYAAVGLGRAGGLSMSLMFVLYALSDLLVFLAAYWLLRRAGRSPLGRLQQRLPRRLRRRLDDAGARAARLGRGKATAPAMFAAGYTNLYLAALFATVSRIRLLPAAAFGISGDLVQFSGAVALAGVLARALPFPSADWVMLLVAPVLVGLIPGFIKAARVAGDYLRRPRPAFLPPVLAPVPVLVPVYADECRPWLR